MPPGYDSFSHCLPSNTELFIFGGRQGINILIMTKFYLIHFLLSWVIVTNIRMEKTRNYNTNTFFIIPKL